MKCFTHGSENGSANALGGNTLIDIFTFFFCYTASGDFGNVSFGRYYRYHTLLAFSVNAREPVLAKRRYIFAARRHQQMKILFDDDTFSSYAHIFFGIIRGFMIFRFSRMPRATFLFFIICHCHIESAR